MNSSTANSGPDVTPPRRRSAARASLRERFESLPVAAQFRVAAVAAVAATLLVVQLVVALWDTAAARSEAVGAARRAASAMATRLSDAGGGALDNLEGYREFLAATFRLQGGQVLQQYVRPGESTAPGSPAAKALEWTAVPSGAGHWIKSRLALEPIYVENSVQLGPNLSGSVSVVVDHHWIWSHALRRLAQAPVALLLGCLIGWLAGNALQRLVAEPLSQLVEATRPTGGSNDRPTAQPGQRGNELTDLAGNFDALADRLVNYEREIVSVRHASSQEIVERTRQLEAKLRRAEALTRSKDDFLANMSHEIRTPLNGVLGMAELLAGTGLDKRQRRFVDSMRAAAETMTQIINDILDDSKIDAGKMELVPEPFDVRDLAEQAGQLYAGRAESKKLEMICRIEPTVPSVVVGDVLRLRQVLGNLLSNAVKYTESGEVEIRVGVDDLRDGHCRLHFGVRDTGPGIPEADRTGIFEPFTQLNNGSRAGGTGLGLSIATRLVRLMGGEKIELSSEVGRGSTFSFVLPFEVRDAAPHPDRASDEFAGLRVLVIDDNPTSFMLLEEMLTNWSAEVSVLNRARLVGDRMHDVATRGKPFDVVLLDHSLPDATTETVLRTIRLDPAVAGTYVVLLSALDFNPSFEGTTAIAPDLCIAKPVRAQLLRNALQESRQPRRAPELARSVAPEAQREPAIERGDLPTLGLDVLVVDDNEINREVAVAMLEELRCKVTTAEDGNAAVAAAMARRFDAILMDCQMPGMDGYAATEAIRRQEEQRGAARTTIIALSANVLSRDRERCLSAGMNSFLAKPFKSLQLLEVLQPIAAQRGTFVAAPAASAAPAGTPPVAAVVRTPPPALPASLESEQAMTRDAPAATLEPQSVEEPESMLSDTAVHAMLEPSATRATVIETPPTDTSTTARLPVLDVEQVQAIRGLGKPQVFERLCEMLFGSAKDMFERLDAALATGNLEEIAAASHALKSPVNNLGGRRLADLLERCETAAREGGDMAVVRRTATGLKPHYAALVAALESELRRATGTR